MITRMVDDIERGGLEPDLELSSNIFSLMFKKYFWNHKVSFLYHIIIRDFSPSKKSGSIKRVRTVQNRILSDSS